MKPLCQEGELICFLEHDRAPTVYIVEKTEDLVLDYTFDSATPTGTIGSFYQIDNVEPKQVSNGGAEIQCYQLRAGVDVGMIYTEMFAGTIRRTPYKQRRPTVSSPYVGFFNQLLSPYGSPRFELWVRYNEKPSFAVYNNLAQAITPTMSFRGKKLRLFDLNKAADTFKALPYQFASAQEVTNLKNAVLKGQAKHRRVTVMGMED
jgi:hypothetical protein